jgi:predicted DNA-binding protein
MDFPRIGILDMPERPKRDKRLGARIPQDVRERLEELAEREDRSFSWAVLECIKVGLEKFERKKPQ